MFCFFLAPAALATVVVVVVVLVITTTAAPLHRVRTQGHFWHIPGATFGIMAIASTPPVGASNLKLVIPVEQKGTENGARFSINNIKQTNI